MTEPFMRVDISLNSRDFQPLVLEAGLPLLDRANSNGQTLRKWLGAFVAEPERTGDTIAFYVRDDDSRRINSVFCVPVTEKEWTGGLSKEFKELQKRVDAIKPESKNEQLLHRVVCEQTRHLASENASRDRQSSLFKFRDGRNKVHLVWAPGYRRRDTEPAAAHVCSNAACSHLFLQRGKASPKCPICQATGRSAKVEVRSRSSLTMLLACLVSIALGVGGAIWWQQQSARRNLEISQAPGADPAEHSSLDIDEIRVTPETMKLVVDECTNLKVSGFKSGKSIGDISHRAALRWDPADDKCVSMNGPQLIARTAGSATLTASIGSVVSHPIKVSVVASDQADKNPAIVGRLTVAPSTLYLKVGEVAKLGCEVNVLRESINFSDSCEVATASNEFVTYDQSTRTFEATSPGDSRIAFIVRNQFVALDVHVERAAPLAEVASVAIEIAHDGPLAVGEILPLRVFVMTPDGTNIPMSANLTSSDSQVATIHGSAIQGLAPGKVFVDANVPGIKQACRAVLTVEEVQFDRLTFNPAVLLVAVGQQKSFEIFGTTSAGRVQLCDSSHLKLVGGKTDEDAGNDISFDVEGVVPGAETVTACWKSGPEQSMSIIVKPDQLLNLVIQPETCAVAEGASVDYVIMAHREGQLQPLDLVDGVEVSVDTPMVAAIKDLRVTAQRAGTTRILAKFRTHQVEAMLTVTSRSRTVESEGL